MRAVDLQTAGWWAACAAARLALLWVPGHPTDLGTFHGWALQLAAHGPWRFYAKAGFVDYLPGYLVLLWPVGYVVGSYPQLAHVLLKALPAAADFAVAWLLVRLGGRAAGVAYLANPATLVVGAWWGQVESVAAAAFLACAWAWVRGRDAWSGVLFGLGVLTKPQYAPAVAVLVWGVGGLRRERVTRVLAGCGAVVALGSVLFATSPWQLAWLLRSASATYPYGSVNALNLWYLVGLNWKPDTTRVLGLPAHVWGPVLVAAYTAWVVRQVAGRKEVPLAALAASAASLGLFVFATRMHERYLFFALPLALLAWAGGRLPGSLCAALSMVAVANLLFGLAYLAHFPQYPGPWTSFAAYLRSPVPEAAAVLGLVLAGWKAWLVQKAACSARLEL